MRLGAVLTLALVLSACGSIAARDLPPAVGPERDEARLADGRRVVLLGRERVLELFDARGRVASVPAGIGPAHVGCLERTWCYVTDKRGDGLLVFQVGAGIQLTRRYRLAGAPDAIVVDRPARRLFVTLSARHERVELVAHGRPHILRAP